MACYHLGHHFMLQVRQSGGGGGGIETANIMLAQLNAQKSVKSKDILRNIKIIKSTELSLDIAFQILSS